MTWREKLNSNLLLRNTLSALFAFPSSVAKNDFTPYFQYKIGVYQRDWYLYFTSQPNNIRYTNDIFNKLNEYDGYGVVQFLEFHYTAYPDKADFFRFLKYETVQRLKRKPGKDFKIKLECTLEWLVEKQEEQHSLQQPEIKTYLEQEVYKLLEKEVNKSSSTKQHTDTQNITKEILDTLSAYLNTLVETTEEKMKALTDAYVTGHIKLNNHNHVEKIVQLFYLIQNISAPKEQAKGEQLFKQFSATDIASILHLHFEDFKTKKINTIQGNIKGATDNLNFKSAKVQKLNEALEAFFYS
jgi:hypothetical protein